MKLDFRNARLTFSFNSDYRQNQPHSANLCHLCFQVLAIRGICNQSHHMNKSKFCTVTLKSPLFCQYAEGLSHCPSSSPHSSSCNVPFLTYTVANLGSKWQRDTLEEILATFLLLWCWTWGSPLHAALPACPPYLTHTSTIKVVLPCLVGNINN